MSETTKMTDDFCRCPGCGTCAAHEELAAARAQVEELEKQLSDALLLVDYEQSAAKEIAADLAQVEALQADLAAVRKVEEWVKRSAWHRVLLDSHGQIGAFDVRHVKHAAGTDIPALGRALAAQEGGDGQ